ncbi:MAG: 3-oxoacyl-[acyl-carrier-protein] synthase [Miltoncostaeaceae bacterium]|jgi:3-oxoacyl-[acyl-carrier-protein] synthase-3|nr:3-oxoacyl-[acyl-carrier-protein] synthase [Miltoncostaeaceae bacterium]
MLRALDPARPRRARLAAVGAHLPQRVVTNHDLAIHADTSDEWIVSRTGIRERRIAAREEAASDLAALAAEGVLQRAGVAASEIDVLIVATATPDHLMPSTACLVANLIGATRAASFDLGAACSGFVYGMVQGTALIEAGLADRVLVMAGEVFSRFTDFTDRSNSFLWGDAGAGALLVGAGPGDARGVVGFELGSDGTGAELITIPAGGSRWPLAPGANGRPSGRAGSAFIQMDGREVYRFAVRTIVESVTRVLDACGLGASDLGLVALHQANLRIIELAAERLGLPRERLLDDIAVHGNTAAASIPLSLATADAAGRLVPDELLLLCGFGAGLAWGTLVVPYEPLTA